MAVVQCLETAALERWPSEHGTGASHVYATLHVDSGTIPKGRQDTSQFMGTCHLPHPV